MNKTFRESIRQALDNPNLADALGRFSEAYRASRAKAYEGIDFEALRTRVAEVKSSAAARLDLLADLFEARARELGAKVFHAADPVAAREYILEVARAQGARTIVKSKSMASEEIHLNPFLQQAGIEVSETDLGEWIVQLAGQRPSHMVLPAIHLTKEDVAALFSKEVDERLSSDIPRLVKVARQELRSRFLRADIGISGANIAVAETGSLVLLTNEGNARLVTTLPRTHIAIVGIEKLVASFADVAPILTALPRSATAQLLTSYVSIITGPVPNDDGSMKDLHIILLDNRRRQMAADPVFRQALQCIRCGSCLNVCPVYRLVGGHVFGRIYTGGIGAILTAWFDELKQSADIQGLCIQCGNCKQYCPAKVDLPALILELRRRLVVEAGVPLAERAIFGIVSHRRLFHSLLRAASLAQKPISKGGFLRHLPHFLAELEESRSLPAIAATPFRDVFSRISQPKCERKAAFYAGCLIDFVYPEIGEAAVRVLNRAGIEVVFPEGQTCCGAPARFNGAYEAAARQAAGNIEALSSEPVDWVVTACPTCTVALKHDYQGVPGAEALAARVIDFSTLAASLTVERTGEPSRFTYHDSCHLRRTLGVYREPRALLEAAGHELVEMDEADMCCGMGGSYSLKLPEISAPILERKLSNIERTGAAVVAMDCPGCLLQIRGGLDKKGVSVAARHTAEILDQR